ncbi:general secretion pathway protein GspK [Methyloferula stellata]|uniref:general secretion pathway protein GspK n=1 Tax=Methyloferula stellata TaxID=876270 RepID=UPI000369A854|nr:type II secretion system protein GspK [Methyloferula stellata]
MTLSRSDPRQGIVLIAVLWTIALLSALAMAASISFRGFASIVAIDRDRARADALLNAGLEVSAGLLARLGDTPLTERQTAVSLSTGVIQIRLSDERGRIDINKAPVKLLAALLRSAGADEDATMIAQSIVAWRKSDDPDQAAAAVRQPPNAPQPGQAGAQQGAPQQPAAQQGDDGSTSKDSGLRTLTDIHQLRAIPGMTPEYIEAILPLATIYGGAKVNALTASPGVLEVVPGLSSGQLTSLLQARSGALTEDRLKQILGSAIDYLTVEGTPVASVELTAQLLDGYTARAKAVFAIVPEDSQPYRVLAWTPLSASEARRSFMADQLQDE